MIDELEWDGTWLGSYSDSIILNTVKSYPFNISHIYIPQLMESGMWVARHQSKSVYPCVIDEIKSIFGMVKIGTHSITIKGKLYILYNTKGRPQLLSETDCEMTDEMKMRVQDVFVFRMIVGLNCNFESSICMINGIPTSYRNRVDVKEENDTSISNAMLKKWFVDSVGNSVRRMIKPSGRTFTARQRIQALIEKLDQDLIWLDNVIFNMMMKLE